MIIYKHGEEVNKMKAIKKIKKLRKLVAELSKLVIVTDVLLTAIKYLLEIIMSILP